jgi:hypothetical protein
VKNLPIFIFGFVDVKFYAAFKKVRFMGSEMSEQKLNKSKIKIQSIRLYQIFKKHNYNNHTNINPIIK